jgi:hypothetical protein
MCKQELHFTLPGCRIAVCSRSAAAASSLDMTVRNAFVKRPTSPSKHQYGCKSRRKREAQMLGKFDTLSKYLVEVSYECRTC